MHVRMICPILDSYNTALYAKQHQSLAAHDTQHIHHNILCQKFSKQYAIVQFHQTTFWWVGHETMAYI